MVGLTDFGVNFRRRLRDSLWTRLWIVSSCLFILMGGFPVFADDVSIEIPNGDIPFIEGVLRDMDAPESRLKHVQSRSESALMTLNGNVLTFNADSYFDASDKSRVNSVKAFVRYLSASDVSLQTQQVIMRRMSAVDKNINAMLAPLLLDEAEADVFTGLRILAPFLDFVRILFGVIAVGGSMTIVGGTLIDILFFAVPKFHENFAENSAGVNLGGSGGVNIYNGGLGNSRQTREAGKPRWVSIAAARALQLSLASMQGQYRSPYGIYLKSRAMDYLWFAACLTYLVFGGLGGLFSRLLGYVSGFTSGF